MAGLREIGRPARLVIAAGLAALATAALILGVETSAVVAALSMVGVGRFMGP
jgi:hypothetical protein